MVLLLINQLAIATAIGLSVHVIVNSGMVYSVVDLSLWHANTLKFHDFTPLAISSNIHLLFYLQV